VGLHAHSYHSQETVDEIAASGWFGTKTSSITRYAFMYIRLAQHIVRREKLTPAPYACPASTSFLEAAHGSQRAFKQDRKARYLQYDNVILRFKLQWREQRTEHEVDDIQYWCVYAYSAPKNMLKHGYQLL
jgi:hypothetical protein